jgi:methylenetetrahydrofolate reductase (NADPH)
MAIDRKIQSGEFIVLGEFEPPKGADFSPLLANANLVKGRVDAFVIPEMANAVMKASSLGGCCFLQTHGFETVLQVSCRDRNRLALQADILAAAGIGISSLMVVPGEEIRYGDHHQARAVYDVDLMELLEGIKRLQQGKDMAGIELQGPPRFLVGTTFNAGATGGAMGVELEELQKRVEKGVQFVITTPVFDVEGFQQTLNRMKDSGAAIIPTVLLLKSAGMARYIDRNISHISIPDDTIKSIQKAPDKARRCVQVAGELITQLKKLGVAGVLISTIGWEDKLPQILDMARV